MEKSFESIGISESIRKAVEAMGFVSPTEVQEKAIPHILNKTDLIVMSKTGSGKTGAFGIPIIQSVQPSPHGPQALILTPTRELAVQVDSDLKQMAKHSNVRTTAIYGQHNMNSEIETLKKGITIVTGTPGRVQDHIKQGNLVTHQIKFLVLDEADRMLDMGFIDQVVRIIKSLPKNRVTLLFSATMPTEIQKICQAYMNSPTTVEIASDTKTVDAIDQCYYRVQHNEKRTQLHRILAAKQPESCMVFCNTRIAVDKVSAFLEGKGYTSEALHGANSQSSRTRVIQQFKKSGFQILVATDVAARGIHIDDLALVVNYDVPVEKDSYVHRIGRTGRAGNIGCAVSLVTSDEIMSLYEIEEHVGALIEEVELPTDAEVSAGYAIMKARALEIKSKRAASGESYKSNTFDKMHSTSAPKTKQGATQKPKREPRAEAHPYKERRVDEKPIRESVQRERPQREKLQKEHVHTPRPKSEPRVEPRIVESAKTPKYRPEDGWKEWPSKAEKSREAAKVATATKTKTQAPKSMWKRVKGLFGIK